MPWYDRPAILRLAGEVAGRRVLELGCAAGVLTGQLADRGADVLALDREPQMVALARRRLQAADLQRPLDMVADASIGLVVASLVLHYLRDWRPLLAELHRCLAPPGALVFSVHHPITGDHPPFGLGISARYAGDRGAERPVLEPHDHLHNKQMSMCSGGQLFVIMHAGSADG
jgi:predicted TPR repeat methyltransferase